ncbi:MAG: glutamate synthase-related protein [Balneolaceae bacterium]
MAYKPSKETRKILKNGLQRAAEPFRAIMRCIEVITVLFVIGGIYLIYSNYVIIGIATITGGFILYGIEELFLQKKSTIVRIYGPLGRLRYIFEQEFRDKFLQYFNERNMDGRPIPRIVRDYIYQRAKDVPAISSFGTELDNFDVENTVNARLLHNNFGQPAHCREFKVTVGEHRKAIRPFDVINTLNISAMSYGALNWKAAESLSNGAAGVAFVNTGEGGFGPHGVAGNDTVFQIGTGKFGVGKKIILDDGTETRKLNEQLLCDLVRQNDHIRMIQLKISQGAKPGIGGHLPGCKVSEEIAAVRKIPVGVAAISPPQHYELISGSPKDSIMKLMDFTKRIRELTSLPVGIKLSVGKLSEIDLLVDAMKITGEGPDDIQLDGADGGTGAGPNLYLNYIGYGGAIEPLVYLNNKLVIAGLRDKVTLNISGRFFTPAHAVVGFAFGADYIQSARGPMLALGCIQSLRCHTNKCPAGITTNQPWRTRAIDIPDKSVRVNCFLRGFHHDMMEITRTLGHEDPRDINPNDIRLMSKDIPFEEYFKDDPEGVIYPPRSVVQ